jgi:hypothetical protein
VIEFEASNVAVGGSGTVAVGFGVSVTVGGRLAVGLRVSVTAGGTVDAGRRVMDGLIVDDGLAGGAVMVGEC